MAGNFLRTSLAPAGCYCWSLASSCSLSVRFAVLSITIPRSFVDSYPFPKSPRSISFSTLAFPFLNPNLRLNLSLYTASRYIRFMSFIKVGTNFNIDIEFTAPSFGRRLGAWAIDVVVLVIYMMLAAEILEAFERSINSDDGGWWTLQAIKLTLFLPFILYHLALEVLVNGQSVGKMAAGIKVVSENGGRPSLGQYIIRWLIRTSDYMLLIIIVVMIITSAYGFVLSSEMYWALALAFGLLVTDLVLVNTRKQQRLGDILAHTVLIRTKQKERITDTVFLEVEDTYVPQFPQIMQLSDRDMNSLKSILDTVRKHRDFNMAAMAAEKIKAHLKIETYMEPEEFLAVLLKDYNYLSAN